MSIRIFELASLALAAAVLVGGIAVQRRNEAPQTEHRFVSVAPAGASEGNVPDFTY